MLDFLEGWGGGLSGTPTLSRLFKNLSIWEVISLWVKDAGTSVVLRARIIQWILRMHMVLG
jgi:hypothetical protein